MLLIAGGLLALLVQDSARAGQQDLKVYSPIVYKGEFELEARGNRTFDSDMGKNNAQQQIYEIGYGVTERWATAVLLEAEKEPGGSLKHTATGWENIIQLFEQGEHWLDAGLYLEYEVAAQAEGANKIESKLLLEKPLGQFLNTLNLIFDKEIGENAASGTDFDYAWRTKWRVNSKFEPGIEAYGQLGKVGNFNSSSQQIHQLGPVITGGFMLGAGLKKLKYELGYLFGLTSASPNGVLKLNLEFEFLL